jgi:hypothetical protein
MDFWLKMEGFKKKKKEKTKQDHLHDYKRNGIMVTAMSSSDLYVLVIPLHLMLSVCCVTNLRKQFHDSCKITTAKTNSGC